MSCLLSLLEVGSISGVAFNETHFHPEPSQSMPPEALKGEIEH